MDEIVKSSQCVLIVGDGNLSFSRSVVTTFSTIGDASKLWYATVYQSEQEVSNNNESNTNADWLRKQTNVNLLFQIDATSLKLHFPSTLFDLVIFNFPHHGGKTNLRLSRQLLNNFFVSCYQVVSPCGQVVVSFAKGQSGLSLETSQDDNLPNHNQDSWQPIYIAAYANLILQKIFTFDRNHFPGYTCSGYKNGSRSFNFEGAQVLVFKRTKTCTLEKDENIQFGAENSDLHKFQPFFVHDISFWMNPKTFCYQDFRKVVQTLSGGAVKKIIIIDEYSCTLSGRQSYCVRFIWQSDKYCLTKETAISLQNLLREKLDTHYCSFDKDFELR